MKALSVQEPWATLIMQHGKTTENRGWSMKYRGDLVICASARPKKIDPEEYVWIVDYFKERALIFGVSEPSLPALDSLEIHPGLALGIVEVVGCDQKFMSYWDEPAQQHIRLQNPRPFARPFAVKGRLGLFEVPYGLVAEAMRGA